MVPKMLSYIYAYLSQVIKGIHRYAFRRRRFVRRIQN